jgi:FAD/FMN-containing dehydrogenase
MKRLDEGATMAIAQHGTWDEARQAWNLLVDQHPAAVALPESPDDVVAAVRLAQARGLRIAAQGTGHGAGPLGDLGDTMLVRTTELREVSIDAVRRRARAGAGAIWDDVARPATAQRAHRAARLVA